MSIQFVAGKLKGEKRYVGLQQSRPTSWENASQMMLGY